MMFYASAFLCDSQGTKTVELGDTGRPSPKKTRIGIIGTDLVRRTLRGAGRKPSTLDEKRFPKPLRYFRSVSAAVTSTLRFFGTDMAVLTAFGARA